MMGNYHHCFLFNPKVGKYMENINTEALLGVIGELLSEEVSILISNHTEYIYYRPGKRIDLKIKVGDKIQEGTLAHKALKIGRASCRERGNNKEREWFMD